MFIRDFWRISNDLFNTNSTFIRDLLKLKQTVRLLEWVRLLETPEDFVYFGELQLVTRPTLPRMIWNIT